MRLTCPACGFHADAEAYLGETAAHGAIASAVKLPQQLGDRLLRYLGLFRPAGGRALTLDRLQRLLGELLQSIGEGRVTRKGRTWVVPIEVWSAALDQVLDGRATLQLPLKTHGYLLEVVIGLVNRAEGAAEQRHIDHQSYRYRDTRQIEGPVSLRSRMPDAVRAALKPGATDAPPQSPQSTNPDQES